MSDLDVKVVVLALRGFGAQGVVESRCQFRNCIAETVVLYTLNDNDTACLIPYQKIKIAPWQICEARALTHPEKYPGKGFKFRVKVPGQGKKVTAIFSTGYYEREYREVTINQSLVDA